MRLSVNEQSQGLIINIVSSILSQGMNTPQFRKHRLQRKLPPSRFAHFSIFQWNCLAFMNMDMQIWQYIQLDRTLEPKHASSHGAFQAASCQGEGSLLLCMPHHK
jgi:hypothetical protein